MSVVVEQNPSVRTVRGKRDIGDLSDYVQGQFQDDGKSAISQVVRIDSFSRTMKLQRPFLFSISAIFESRRH